MTPLPVATRRVISSSPQDTQAFAARLASKVKPGDVILLIANLGAGKTTFVQGFVRRFGVADRAVSPTFVLAQTYEGRIPVHHLDFYRVTPKELIEIGVQDYLTGQGELALGVVLIEWADRCPNLWPRERIEIEIKIEAKTQKRILKVKGVGERFHKIVQSTR